MTQRKCSFGNAKQRDLNLKWIIRKYLRFNNRYYFLICMGMVRPFKILPHVVITFSFSGGCCVIKTTQCDLDPGYELPV